MQIESLIPQYSLTDFVEVQNLCVTFEEIASTSTTLPPGEIETPPKNIHRDQELKATFTWDYINEFSAESIKLFFQLFFEKMGSGADNEWPLIPTAETLLPSTFVLTPGSHVITVPPGTLAEGVYKVVASVKMGMGATPVGSILAAFKEIGMLNVYEAKTL